MHKIWLGLLGTFLVALAGWAVFGVDEIQHRIAIFAIVGVVLTAITSVLTIVISNRDAKERETMLLIRREQQKAYSHFYNSFFELMKNIKKTGNAQVQKKASEEMFLFKQGLMNWGSEELIKSFLEYEEEISAPSPESTGILLAGDKFIKSLRKERKRPAIDGLNG